MSLLVQFGSVVVILEKIKVELSDEKSEKSMKIHGFGTPKS